MNNSEVGAKIRPGNDVNIECRDGHSFVWPGKGKVLHGLMVLEVLSECPDRKTLLNESRSIDCL